MASYEKTVERNRGVRRAY